MEEVKRAEIDEDVIKDMHKAQIDLGLSNEKQFRRTELNFYCEFLSVLKDFNKSLSELHNTVTMATADKLTGYMKEFAKNFKEEEESVKNVLRNPN